MKNLFFTITAAIFLTSCSTTSVVYQVFQTQSKDATYDSQKGNYNYENSNVKIDYDFWSDKGEMYFRFYNKSDKPIYVDLNKSHLIHNGQVFDYYIETTKTVSNQTVEARTASGLFYPYYDSKVSAIKAESGTMVKTKPVIQIPPKSYSVFKYYKLMEQRYSSCGQHYAGKGDPESKSFTEDDTPLKFRNYITYDFNEAFSSPMIIDNSFWVDKVLYMKEDPYKGKGSYEKDCNGDRGDYTYSYPYWKNNNFYYRIVFTN